MNSGITILFLLSLMVSSCATFDGTVDHSKVCELHDAKMRVSRTWIRYGLYYGKPETDQDLYPNPKRKYRGGCVVYPKRDRIYKYYACSVCTKAKKEADL